MQWCCERSEGVSAVTLAVCSGVVARLKKEKERSSVLNVGYRGNFGCRNWMSDFGFWRYFGDI